MNINAAKIYKFEKLVYESEIKIQMQFHAVFDTVALRVKKTIMAREMWTVGERAVNRSGILWLSFETSGDVTH